MLYYLLVRTFGIRLTSPKTLVSIFGVYFMLLLESEAQRSPVPHGKNEVHLWRRMRW